MIEPELGRDGFETLRGVIALEEAARALDWVRRNRGDDRLFAARDVFDRERPLPIKIRRLWQYDPDFWQSFIAASGLLAIVCARLASSCRLIRSAAFMKHAQSGSEVGWHRDETLWSHRVDAGLTAWIPLTPAPESAGCLRFLPGSHRRSAGRLYFDPRHPYHRVMDVSEMGLPITAPAGVGDCILMDKATVHSSGPNSEAHERIALVLAFAVCNREDLNEPALTIVDGAIGGAG